MSTREISKTVSKRAMEFNSFSQGLRNLAYSRVNGMMGSQMGEESYLIMRLR